MSQHQFRNQAFGLEAKPVRLYAKFTVGTTGAPTLAAAVSKGVTSVTRNSAGDYTIKFDDSYVGILTVDATVRNATGICASPNLGIKTAGTNVNTTGAGTMEIVFSTGGTATELVSGDVVHLEFVLSDSNL